MVKSLSYVHSMSFDTHFGHFVDDFSFYVNKEIIHNKPRLTIDSLRRLPLQVGIVVLADGPLKTAWSRGGMIAKLLKGLENTLKDYSIHRLTDCSILKKNQTWR